MQRKCKCESRQRDSDKKGREKGSQGDEWEDRSKGLDKFKSVLARNTVVIMIANVWGIRQVRNTLLN